MKYRVLDQNLTAVALGEFCARVEDGVIDLPDNMARDFLAVGMIAPVVDEETANDGLRQPERRQSRARQRRDD